MSTLTQRLFYNFRAVRTVLTGVVRGDSYCYYPEHLTKILQPTAEVRPCSIRDRLGKFAVFNYVPHLQVLVCHQVVRLDYAPCQLHGKVFTLPTYLEVLSTQAISTLDSIFRAFFCVRKLPLKPFQGFFRLSQMTGMINSLTVGIGVEVSQPNIKTDGLSCWLSLLNPTKVDTKLNVVPVSSTNYANSFNLFQLIKVQATSSPQLKASSLKAIGESDSSSILRQHPACCFVFNRTVSLMLFKAGESLQSLLAFFTVVVEPSNSRPSSLSRCLSSFASLR